MIGELDDLIKEKLGFTDQEIKKISPILGEIVNYGIRNEPLHAADFRVAHFATALTFGINNITSALHGELDSIDEHIREKFQYVEQIVEKIRSTFMYNPKHAAWFDKENVVLFNKKIAELCQKETHTLVEEGEEKLFIDQEKNIQYNKSTIHFTIAALITQMYVILVALAIPIIIGMYGWSLHNKNKNIKRDFKLDEVENKNPMLDGINYGG